MPSRFALKFRLCFAQGVLFVILLKIYHGYSAEHQDPQIDYAQGHINDRYKLIVIIKINILQDGHIILPLKIDQASVKVG